MADVTDTRKGRWFWSSTEESVRVLLFLFEFFKLYFLAPALVFAPVVAVAVAISVTSAVTATAVPVAAALAVLAVLPVLSVTESHLIALVAARERERSYVNNISKETRSVSDG